MAERQPWYAALRIPDRFFPAAPIAVATAVLAWRTLRAVLAQVGEPCATLDDSFIHFQYARAIAEMHPLRYQAGAPMTSGATSFLWPALLAPFYAVGFRGMSIVWPAWALGFVALGALAVEAYHIARPLTGKSGGAATAAMVLCFAAFGWCAASGMEVIPFAWALARCVRRTSEWVEAREEERTRKRRIELVVLAFVVALLRPEGAVASLGIALALCVWLPAPAPAAGSAAWKRHLPRLWGLAGVAAAGSVPALLWMLTGHARANTAVAKLLVGNPYYHGHALWEAVRGNLKTFFVTLLNGQVWSTEFLPTNAMPLTVMALLAVPIAGWQKHKLFRAGAVLVLALMMLVPCFYVTFLWNRLRYLWPFATGWLVALSCLGVVLGEVATLVHPRAKMGVPILLGAFAGAFAVRIDWSIDDVANSARGIDKQHVKIGRWAKDNLPEDALIGVNDTGAIAYFSDRRTFDIVGLTTNGEARYWVAGTASRLEHYERMHGERPQALPTHFIVYPEWMGTDAFFGKQLFDATVTDSTILGGQSMRAYTADWTLLDSGAKPWSARDAVIVDELDVADLESEEAHRYDLAGTKDNEEVVGDSSSPDGDRVIDGGRGYRTADRFVARLRAGQAARGIMRVGVRAKTTFDVRAGGELVASFTAGGLPDGDGSGGADELLAPEWVEKSFDLPAGATKEATPLEIVSREGSLFSSYHYWFVAP